MKLLSRSRVDAADIKRAWRRLRNQGAFWGPDSWCDFKQRRGAVVFEDLHREHLAKVAREEELARARAAEDPPRP